MDIKNNKQLIISVMVMSLGLLMVLGTSYSLITKTYSSTNSYSLTVGNIEVSFDSDNENNITLTNSYPISDKEGLESDKEFSFRVNNTGNYTANYSISIEETSPVKIGEVIRFSYNLNDTGYTKISTLSNNNIVTQNMVLEANKIDEYKIKFWVKEDASISYMNKSFSAKLVLNATQNDYKYATNVIELLAKIKEDGLYAIDEEGNPTEKNAREYRYIGTDVNNYVWFNCDDGYKKGSNHCELWRIIGSFDNTWENGIGTYKTLKIMRDEPINTTIPFNKDTYIGEYETSYLNYYANSTYYNELEMHAKNMILTARWDVGQSNHNVDLYNAYNFGKNSTIYGDIGTISLSDYGYARGGMFNVTIDNQVPSWMYKEGYKLLTINTSLSSPNSVNIIEDNKVSTGSYDTEYHFIPAVYLKPDVSITGGYGTLNEPYEIEIKFPMSYGTIEEIK